MRKEARLFFLDAMIFRVSSRDWTCRKDKNQSKQCLQHPLYRGTHHAEQREANKKNSRPRRPNRLHALGPKTTTSNLNVLKFQDDPKSVHQTITEHVNTRVSIIGIQKINPKF
jgi:hypothetical protein